ncbi:hypothetical protein AVEN_273532-1 [Araneus ventricosus]|uniref:Uncharacterized protein n=1 Tax=Araneus ventricosus TaxID=182803 RepID=A0A4Y2H5D0_ARAVE|nr:hypothetical protein AVEN_273532-1 [Araneus ventricosus]
MHDAEIIQKAPQDRQQVLDLPNLTNIVEPRITSTSHNENYDIIEETDSSKGVTRLPTQSFLQNESPFQVGSFRVDDEPTWLAEAGKLNKEIRLNYQGKGNCRRFLTTAVNFGATDYVDLIDWQACNVKSPPVLRDQFSRTSEDDTGRWANGRLGLH